MIDSSKADLLFFNGVGGFQFMGARFCYSIVYIEFKINHEPQMVHSVKDTPLLKTSFKTWYSFGLILNFLIIVKQGWGTSLAGKWRFSKIFID